MNETILLALAFGGGSGGVTLNAPTISISNDVLTITDGNNGSFSQYFDIYADGTLVDTIDKSVTTYDLTTLGFTSGNHTIGVSVKGEGVKPSTITETAYNFYSITKSVTNGTITGVSTFTTNSTVMLQITPDQGYRNPDSVSVTGTVTSGYDVTTGVVSLSNPTSDVSVFAECETALSPYLQFSSDASFTIAWAGTKTWDGTLEYSTDNTTWNTFSGTAVTSALVGNNYVLYMRGKNNTVIGGETYSNHFNITGNAVHCLGSAEMLLDYEQAYQGLHPTMGNRAFHYLFSGCTSLTTAPELPATTLANDCYRSMFQGCTSLTTAPSLPATTLANDCYQLMFFGCTSLTTAPSLPATTLSQSCYDSMFQGCTSLTTAPELPATTLAAGCYNAMFFGCTSLATASALPATTLAKACYYMMFYGCTSLTSIPALPATTLTEQCYNMMFSGASLIKLSTVQNATYINAYRIPWDGTGTAESNSLTAMFGSTGGSFTGTPTINTIYYTSNDIIPAA